MRLVEILTLFDYNYWANDRVLAAAAKVTDAQFTALAPAVSNGSLRGALLHVLNAEWIWRMRCHEGLSPSGLLMEEDFPTLETLRTRWQTDEQTMRTFLAGLRDDDLTDPVKYKTTSGTPHENTLWHILVHVVNHGTQFRSEAAVLLSEYSQSPGDLDFIYFLRLRSQGSLKP